MAEYFSNIIQNKTPFYKDYKIHRVNDKTERWVFGHGQWFRIINGKFQKMIGTIEDITDRKKAEIEIKESEALYRSLVDASPDAIIVTDTKGKITFLSKKTLEFAQ